MFNIKLSMSDNQQLFSELKFNLNRKLKRN